MSTNTEEYDSFETIRWKFRTESRLEEMRVLMQKLIDSCSDCGGLGWTMVAQEITGYGGWHRCVRCYKAIDYLRGRS